MIVGNGNYRYQPIPDWAKLPAGWSFVEVVGISVDSRDRAFVFCRGEHPVVIFEPDGTFAGAWGEGLFKRPHGITIGPGDVVWCTDDMGHTVRKFSADGKLLLTLGSGQPTDTGIVGMDYRTIKRPGPPFNMPTNVAIAPSGELYITDGYGNARVHKFSSEGKLLFSWGGAGDGPGQFNLPHGIAIDGHGRVYVADRENSRIQVFSGEGKFLSQWTDTGRPMQICFDGDDRAFVCDVGFRAGLFPFQTPPPPPVRGAYVSVFDTEGRLLSRWGGSDDPCAPGDFFAPHGVCVDSRGAVYVGEVVMSAGGRQGKVPPTCHSLQKFVPAA
ncbi:MAG: peptidyl-alpha-hydroxyglycine alpha-amidating lyase family protein [Deltaproteobacteria bacterium]